MTIDFIRVHSVAVILLVFIVSGCTQKPRPARIDQVAERYLRLTLHLDVHDPGYVDAYHGPVELREEARAQTRPLPELRLEADSLLAVLGSLVAAEDDEMLVLRQAYLTAYLEAFKARVEMMEGRKFTFDEESLALYKAVSPQFPPEHYDKILAQLEDLLPGKGSLSERYNRFKDQFNIPPDKLELVFTTAIAEARRRTREAIDLPETESFELEFVTDQAWSGYNWYQGNYQSLIQVNTDLPIAISRAIDLASHEGYPGHHVYNLLLEQKLLEERGWVEFSVYPLYSPMSLIAEGTANYGIEVAFPGNNRIAYEKEVLFPLAGLDPSKADLYYEVLDVVDRLDYAANEAARGYLDGTMSADKAVDWMIRYNLFSPERARKRLKFIDIYRSYVINYNLGQDMVRWFVESQGGTEDDPARRWEIFKQLLASPRMATSLN